MSTGPEPVVRARHVSLRFGARVLWDDLSFDLHRGEFMAVLGPNGTGKTSLVRILLGLVAPSAGTVSVTGRAAGRGPGADRVRPPAARV